MKRVVLDTNVLISSALGGALAPVLEQWSEGKFIVIVSTEIFEEYLEVLSRPRFGLPQATIDKVTRFIYRFAEFVVADERMRVVADDPDDDKFLEAAVADRADCIVSGDRHLLEIGQFRSIPILNGRAFLNWLNEQE